MATNDPISFEVEGLKHLESQLLKLGKKVASKELKKALAKSVRPTIKDAKAFVPVNTGGLRQSIGYATRQGKYKNIATVFVGPKPANKKAVELANIGRSKKIKGVFYGHIVELGYGRQRPQPFLRPAFDGNAEKATGIFSAELKKGIESVATK